MPRDILPHDTTCLIAGSGNLPEQIIKSCLRLGKKIFVIYLQTGYNPPPSLGQVPHLILNIGAVGKAIRTLRKEGIKHIVMAGAIKRPKFSELRLDIGGIKLLTRVSTAKLRGDNSLLVTVIKFFEDANFVVIGVDQLLREVLMPEGALGKTRPQGKALSDIKLGMEIARAIGDLDIGQAVVVQNGVVLGVEAIEGTDALLERCGKLKLANNVGVLVKMKKPMQDSRVDLPTIGSETIINAHKAGLAGVAIEAGSALIVDKDEVVKMADKLGLFVVGV